jgi:holliday junction resolvase YEN1
LLKEIGKGERIALSKLAVEFLERNRRPIRIAIDIAIWQFQNQAGQGGQNPALRTFYYRLLRLLALPIQPLFVYDGPKKPLAKRNKVVSRYGTTSLQNEMSKKLLELFRFPYWTAPGEAEAECALLQRESVVDAVMSQDVDAVMWGSTMTLRDWSREGTRGNKTATHVNVIRAEETKKASGLDSDGMILVALLSGGDYAPDGVPGFGPGLTCEVARADFGSELLEVMSKSDKAGLSDWKDRLHYELDTNESGYFRTKHKSVKLPGEFPDQTIVNYYTHPVVSPPTELPRLRKGLQGTWDGDVGIVELREYVAQTFNWQYRGGACKFIRSLAPSLLAQRLLRCQRNTTISSNYAILERRKHFVNDGMPELRIAAVPSDIVGLNIEDEEDSPEYVQAREDAAAAEEEADSLADPAEPDDGQQGTASNMSRHRKKAPWDPRNPEKMWVPETLVKLGLPNLVEEWEQKQRDMLTDPKKFIANKARKMNPLTAATKPTRSIQAYFATAKPTVTALPARAPSPKKALSGPIGPSTNDQNFRASSTPTRRKTKAPVVEQQNSSPPSSTNPFSIASKARAQTTSAASKPSLPLEKPIEDPPANTSNEPIRRKPRPMQKSKTLPASFPEPILIHSSPTPPPSPTLRASTKVPPPPPPSLRAAPQTPETPNDDGNCSSSENSLPSPAQLLDPIKERSSRRRKSTPSSTTNPRRRTSNHPPLSEIFGQYARTAVANEVKCGSHRKTKEKSREKKMIVLPRDSLPGTWREVLESGGAGAVAEEELEERQRMMPRVSLVDLTEL